MEENRISFKGITLKREIVDGVLVIYLIGDCTHDNYKDFGTNLNAIIGDYNKVVLEISGLRSMISAGYASLVKNKKNVEKRGGVLVLANPTYQFKLIAENIRLDQIFDFYDKLDVAVNALK